jgi:hypothetical protein
MKAIYIGQDFYRKSGTMMSCVYTEEGERTDWGFIQCALEAGESVSIRPATDAEIGKYHKILAQKYSR